MSDTTTPTNLHLKKTEALLISWADGHQSELPLRLLRKYCPCAGCQGERDILGRTILPIVKTTYDGPITANGAEFTDSASVGRDTRSTGQRRPSSWQSYAFLASRKRGNAS